MNEVSRVAAYPTVVGLIAMAVILGLLLSGIAAAIAAQFYHAESRRNTKIISFLSGGIVIAAFIGLFLVRLGHTTAVHSISEIETMSSTVAVEPKSQPTNINAEFSTTSDLRLDENSAGNGLRSQPLLPNDHPEWVAQVDRVDGEVHRISVATELSNSVKECRAKLDDALLEGTRRYIDEHLADNQKVASKLASLNTAWIRAKLLKSDLEYDAEIVRPSDTYHQLWVQLEIGRQDRETIQKWIQQLETTRRVGVVAFVAGGLVLCLSALNAGFRMFSKAMVN